MMARRAAIIGIAIHIHVDGDIRWLPLAPYMLLLRYVDNTEITFTPMALVLRS